MNAVAFGDFAYFHTIAISLQDRTSLGKFNGFIGGIRLYDDEPANGFLDLAKRTIGNYVVVPYHPAVLKGQTSPAAEFVLGGNPADPVHRLLHPNLDLFRGGHFAAVFVPEDQYEFVHFALFLIVWKN
jgi:hypothetical protein